MAPREQKFLATFLVRLVMGVLLCVVASAEVPEILTLSDQAANDFTICGTSEAVCSDSQSVRNTRGERLTIEISSNVSRLAQPQFSCGERSLSIDLLALLSVSRT
jgi:hypothetical protein